MVQYIPKSTLVAEIDKFMYDANLEADIASTGECFNEEVANAKYKLCKQIKEKIDTLEVKEVDLDYIKNELDEVVRIYKPDGDFGCGTLYNVAKHFFELGLNASNPLTWEDISVIRQTMAEYRREENHERNNEDFCKEVLKRFKAQKGE